MTARDIAIFTPAEDGQDCIAGFPICPDASQRETLLMMPLK